MKMKSKIFILVLVLLVVLLAVLSFLIISAGRNVGSLQTPIISIENFENSESDIHGIGIFADKEYDVDEQLFKALENDDIMTNVLTLLQKEPTFFEKIKDILETYIKYNIITEPALKLNHCPKSSSKMNTYLKKIDNGWYLFSKRKILIGEELTVDYNDTPYYIAKPDPNWKC